MSDSKILAALMRNRAQRAVLRIRGGDIVERSLPPEVKARTGTVILPRAEAIALMAVASVVLDLKEQVRDMTEDDALATLAALQDFDNRARGQEGATA